MVEQLVANQLAGVRFSYPAQQSETWFASARHQMWSATARGISTEKHDNDRAFLLISNCNHSIINNEAISQVFEQFSFLFTTTIFE